MTVQTPTKNEDIDIASFFRYLNTRGIPYCVVGPTDKLPDQVESDLDIVMDVEPQVALRHIGMYCQSQGLRVVQHLQHEISANYYVLWKKSKRDDRFVSIDVCRDYLRDARLFLSGQELVSGRHKSVGPDGHELFYVPRPELAFIYYLIKHVDKLQLNEKHVAYLSRMWRETPQEAHDQLVRYFRGSDVAAIERAAESGNWDDFGRDTTARRHLHRRMPRLSMKMWCAEAFRIFKRIIRPTGIHVVFLGPDGSGKSSVIEGVLQELEPVFRRLARYHLFPAGSANRSERRVVVPHERAPRSTVPSSMQLILWLLRYTIGWARDIWPANIKSTAILFDRYYHDVLVDPRRYRYGGPTWWARALGWLVPKPDLWILLDAPADVLQARKTEVPAQESERQRRAYVALVESFDNGIVIDSSNPLDDVRREATRGILEFMAHRTEDRLGLGFSSPPPHSTGVAP